MSQTILTSLHDAIRPLHDEAEGRGPLSTIMDGTITREGYTHALLRLYGFIAPLEAGLSRHEGLAATGLDMASRRRLPHLLQDLAHMGIGPAQVARTPVFPGPFGRGSLPEAMGFLYLLEGSRMGGLLLAEKLGEQFGYTETAGATYFSSGHSIHDGRPSATTRHAATLWKDFREQVRQWFAESPSPRHDGPRMLAAATGGFSALNRWLEGGVPAPRSGQIAGAATGNVA